MQFSGQHKKKTLEHIFVKLKNVNLSFLKM